MGSQFKKKVDRKLAYAVLCGARPFNLFEEHHMKEFIEALAPHYKLPSRRQIGGRLLQEVYDETTLKIGSFLEKFSRLTVAIDESSNISLDRVINRSLVTPIGAAHVTSQKVELGATLSADWIWGWAKPQIHRIMSKIFPS